MIREYFKKVEGSLSDCPLAIHFQYDFTIVDFDRGFWKSCIKFLAGFELHLFEYVIIERGIKELDAYRYHFQGPEEKLVFRFDNAPHHPEIESHPHHLHSSHNISSTSRPELEDVLDKATREIS